MSRRRKLQSLAVTKIQNNEKAYRRKGDEEAKKPKQKAAVPKGSRETTDREERSREEGGCACVAQPARD